MILTVRTLRTRTIRDLQGAENLLLVSEIIQVDIRIHMVEVDAATMLDFARSGIPRILVRCFSDGLFAWLVHGGRFKNPRVCITFTFAEVTLNGLVHVAKLVRVVQVGFITGGERFQTAILGRGTTRGGNNLPTLRQSDTSTANIKADTLQLAQRALIAVVVNRIEDVTSLTFGGSQAENLRHLHHTADRLTLRIRVDLAQKLVSLPLFRPMIEPARSQTLERANASGLTGLVLTLRTRIKHTIEPAGTPLGQRIGVQHEHVLVHVERLGQANTATTTNTEESLNPPNREHSHRTSQILAMQFGNARMHQAPPSMTRKPNAEARCLFR